LRRLEGLRSRLRPLADRAAALTRLREAIGATRIDGVATNLPFHDMLLAHPEFQAGSVDTGFVARLLEARATPAGGPKHHG